MLDYLNQMNDDLDEIKFNFKEMWIHKHVYLRVKQEIYACLTLKTLAPQKAFLWADVISHYFKKEFSDNGDCIYCEKLSRRLFINHTVPSV